MKFREFLYLIGLKPREETYGHYVEQFQLDGIGEIDFANWQHPKCFRKTVSQLDLDLLQEFVEPGDTAIDIGAHIGDTTTRMALAVGSEGCVFGFEPNPKVYEVFKVNAGLNEGKMRIIPFPYAATEEPGKLTFTYSDPGFCNGGEHRGVSRWRHAHAFDVEVEGVNVEKLLREKYPEELKKLKYIKTDAEGADLFVLESMRGLIDEFKPYVRSEVYKHTSKEQRESLFRFFLDRGYSLHEFEDGGTSFKGRALTINDVQHAEKYDIFAIPPAGD